MPEKTENFQFSYDEVFNSDSSCDRTKSLYEYFQNVLPEEHLQDFERHLSSCEVCLKLLIELQQSEVNGQSLVLDAAKAEKIYEEGRLKIGPKRPAAIHPATSPGFRFSSRMNALMLLLVVILAYPAYRSFVLRQEVRELKNELQRMKAEPLPDISREQPAPPELRPVSQPIASPAMIYAVRSERNSESRIIRLQFDQPSATLILSVPTEDFESHKVELIRKNETIWFSEVSSSRKEMSQLISIHLQKDFLQAGEYRLRITGQEATRQTSFPEYRLIVK